MAHEIITITEAREKGLKHYFTGKPCKRGHIAKRHTSTRKCMECSAIYTSGYRERNPEKVKDYQNKRWKENGDELRRRCLQWQRENKYYERNRERIADYQKRYYQANKEAVMQRQKDYAERNPDVIRAASRAAKYRRRKREGRAIKARELRAWLDSQDKVCAYCGEKCEDSFQIDHIIPIARGGANDVANLAIACGPCNRSKGAKTPEEFAEYISNYVIKNSS